MIEVRLLGPADATVLERVADDVFDGPIDPERVREFLADSRHHLAVALFEGTVVGMASAVHYVHPDKAPELWINEVGVATGHRRQGLARRLLDALREHGVVLGCTNAWVLTEPGNDAANALYGALGGAREETVLYDFQL